MIELIDYHGLPVALAAPDDALELQPAALSDRADIVRVEGPPLDTWGALREAGFIVKPQFVTWLAEVRDSEEAYFAELPKRERQKIRAARRDAARERLTITTRAVDESLLDVFLALYQQQVSTMRHGVAWAVEQRQSVLAEAETYSAICAHLPGGELVGSCLVQGDAARDTVRVRFSAVDDSRRESGLSRVLYMEAAQLARDLGHRLFSLGRDRNLYGHIAKPGLLRFKSHLGFTAYPSEEVDPSVGCDQADLVVALRQLSDPTMILGYADDRPTRRLQLEAFSERADLDVRPFEAHFLHGARAHTVDRERHATTVRTHG